MDEVIKICCDLSKVTSREKPGYMRETLSIQHYFCVLLYTYMSKNVLGADNPQGSPLSVKNRHDPSETTRRAPSTKREILAYLGGAAHDATLNKRRRVRFAQKELGWLKVLQSLLKEIGHASWIYKEGRERTVYVLETMCNEINFSFYPCSREEKRFYVKGFFDAEGGIPRNQKRFYIQLAQKSRKKIELIKSALNDLGIKCGKVHNPSVRVNPDYWRVFVLRDSHDKFLCKIGSLHPIKSALICRRMMI